MFFGSMPRDKGFLSKIGEEEAERIRETDPIASKYLRKLIGATELIKGGTRYCLWLVSASPEELRSSPVLQERVSAVRRERLISKAKSTRAMAETSHLFAQIAQPKTHYIAVPRVSSEAREYIPMGYEGPEVIASDALLTIPDAPLFVFATLMSRVFNTWNRCVSGRLKSDTRISQEITYNNFPLPSLELDAQARLNATGQAILDARAEHANATLADLYGRNSMPANLVKAHADNDKAVLKVFGLKSAATDEEILKRLFELYVELTGDLFS
jgi:hypothetical protein